MPKISIIIPMFNAERTITRCLESVMKQSESDFEAIIINDGSTDRCEELCKGYMVDKRIRLISISNQGVSTARNIGLDSSTGEYVTFLDSDDELFENSLEILLHTMENTHADLIVAGISIVEENIKTKEFNFPNKLYASSELWTEICRDSQPWGYSFAKLFKRSIIGNTRFQTNMNSQEDLRFCLEVYRKCKTVRSISESVYRYHYALSHRKHQCIDYIENQMRIYQYSSIYRPDIRAIQSIANRVDQLIYGALYCFQSKRELDLLLFSMMDIDNFLEFINIPSITWKHRFIINSMKKKQFGRIYLYVMLRKMAGRILHRQKE